MAIFGEKMAKIGLIDKSRWALQGILQKSMGYENYLFILSVFKVFLFKWYRREADFNFFLDLLNESDVVLDVGASLGVTTTLISRRVRTGVVYAFEPIPLSYNNLERLIRFFIGLTELSDRAKEIVRICLDCPRELEKVVGRKGRHVFLTKNDLRSYLYFNGWNLLEINWAFHEIELFLAKGFN